MQLIFAHSALAKITPETSLDSKTDVLHFVKYWFTAKLGDLRGPQQFDEQNPNTELCDNMQTTYELGLEIFFTFLPWCNLATSLQTEPRWP